MIQEVFADVLLGLAVAVVLASALGILVMRGVYRKLHFVTPAALVAPALVALAVFVQQGLDENTGETLLALLLIVIAGPYLTHATIRAARIREKGRLASRERRPGPTPGGDPMSALVHAPHLAAVTTPYTVPPALMDVLQITVLVLVAAGATAVVLTREPLRQVVVLSGYGLLLAILFMVFQAPDVTLSELTVGAVALPLLLLLALAKVRRREE